MLLNGWVLFVMRVEAQSCRAEANRIVQVIHKTFLFTYKYWWEQFGQRENSQRDVTVAERVCLIKGAGGFTSPNWLPSFYMIEASPCRTPSALFFSSDWALKLRTRERISFLAPDVAWQIIDAVREHASVPQCQLTPHYKQNWQPEIRLQEFLLLKAISACNAPIK